MIKYSLTILIIIGSALLFYSCEKAENSNDKTEQKTSNFSELESFYQEWREFENPPELNGAPDYTQETFQKRRPIFEQLQSKLLAFDTSAWTIEQKVDWYIIWAEMNGYDFNQRVLKPWVRDPSFYRSVYDYRSDVPAHEGPTHHHTTEVWTYDFPLDAESREKFIDDLKVIKPLNEQAKVNLTGNARELWIAGIRHIESQRKGLEEILELPGIKDDPEIPQLIEEASKSSDELAEWLKSEADSKTGPSGIGKENYTWYQQNVHLVPLTWDDEVMILKRELARAWSSLKLEEHKNRNLPIQTDANSPEAFDTLTEFAANSIMRFLKDQDIVTVKDYWEPALREHLGEFTAREDRHFFDIGLHIDPRPLYSHFYHWFELARMDNEPHKRIIRRAPLLYNIFDSRNEGTATAVEEMFMQAGLYENSPRSKEIVYIMIAQRAARGLGSLYAHANEMTMEEAGGIHSKYTPRGWVATDESLLIFEQHLYMRQPGYGTSYITGKYLLESAMADYAKMKETKNEDFHLKEFMDKLNSIGCIPISLGHWEMTGGNNHMQIILKH